MDRRKILILSVGSLLGQNLLDALTGRRDKVEVIGVNLYIDIPRLYRCDRAYQVPPSEDPACTQRILEIIRVEEPHIILPGRDADVVFLSRLKADHPALGNRIPCGSPQAIEIITDKLLSYRFAAENNLPFADTLPLGGSDLAAIERWLRGHPFPVLVKPRHGHGSLGVRIITAREEIEKLAASSTNGLLLQEMLDVNELVARQIERFKSESGNGVPLFFTIDEHAQYSGQILIKPDGRLSRPFCSVQKLVIGRVERSEAVDDPILHETTVRFAQAMAEIGWRGALNVQCKMAPDGTYKGHEMNGRMSGATSARCLLGFDEMRETIKAFAGWDIGLGPGETDGTTGFVYRSLTDEFVSSDDMDTLRETGVWNSNGEGPY